MTSPQINNQLSPIELASRIEHYQVLIQDKKIPYDIRLDFCYTLMYYIKLYNQSPVVRPVSISSSLNIAA